MLELAREPESGAEACRQRGMDRTGFCDWKRRVQTQDFEGLKDRPPIRKSHPQTPPLETVARLRELALAHTAQACLCEAQLALEGIRGSAITSRKILTDSGRGRRVERCLALKARNAEQAIEMAPEQAGFLEKLNPCFRERHEESSAPGELLSADAFFVGSRKGVGNVDLHAVVDTFGSDPFGLLHVSNPPEAAAGVLHHDVRRFDGNLDLPVGASLTGPTVDAAPG